MSYEVVVADALNTVRFTSSQDVGNMGLQSVFGILPRTLSDLFNEVSKARPDLLIGKIDIPTSRLVISGSSIALAPRSSSLIRYVTETLSLAGCRRVLAEVLSDDWTTDHSEMAGGVPATLFHGTSDSELESIWRVGLTKVATPNWERGTSGEISLAAEPHVAAMHAYETAEKRGGRPIVIECKTPAKLVADWDVTNLLSANSSIPSNDSNVLSREVGLFATPDDIPPNALLRITEPFRRRQYQAWLQR